MRKIVLFLYLASFIWAEEAVSKKPYEATWMKILKVDNGYAVLNYPNLWNDRKTKSPWIVKAKKDSMTWITYSDKSKVFKFDGFVEIVKLSDSSYKFNSKIGNNFRFDYVDKANHIAQWSIYYSYGKLQGANLYIDSLYNTFPVVDVEFEEEDDECCDY